MCLHEEDLTQDVGVVADSVITPASHVEHKPVIKAYLGAS